jgi:catechol 2,3-dioxygenase-like lactoylglutathione lyase family enzyme
MRRIVIIIGIIIGIISMMISFQANSQHQEPKAMKMNAGIVTPKLKESKAFYQQVLNFEITFENEFYLLMHTPGHTAEISFLLPEHPSQRPLFQKAFTGQGVYLTLEVTDVDAEYKRIKDLGIPIVVDLRNEEWGDRHFAIKDPNGIGVDIVTYSAKP